MKRVSREFTVAPEVRHEVREPVAEVELGETFVVETINFRTPVIRTPEDVERFTGLVVLGSIPTIASEDAASHSRASKWRRWLRWGT